MPHPKVKLSDDSGNAVSVTSNRLDVNAYLSATPTIDIGDVSLLLGGTAASVNAGTMDAQTLRITIATDDTHFGAVGSAADNDGNIHGQLRFMNDRLICIDNEITSADANLSSLVASISTFGTSTYTEGSTTGRVAGAVRNDTLAALADTENEIAPLQANAIGALYVTGESKQLTAVTDYGFGIMGEAKIIDGSALPNTVGEGNAARLAVSRAGIAYTCLTDDAGASDLGAAMAVDLAAIEALLITIDSDTDAIKTAVQILDDWDDSNYANVNINLAGSDAPTGGGSESGALRVTLANDSTGVISIDDGGNTITVDGTVTANLSSTDNTVLDNILTKNTEIDAVLDTIKVDTEAIETAVELLDNAIDGNEMQVDIVSSATLSVNSHAVTNAGTFVTQIDGDALTSLQLIDDAVAAEGEALGKGILLQGDDGTDRHNINVDTSGRVKVKVDSITNGGINHPFQIVGTSYTATDAHVLGSVAVRNDTLAALTSVIDGDWSSLQVDAEGALYTTHGVTGMQSDNNEGVDSSTAEVLKSSTACKRVDMQADPANTGYIYVGGSDVSATKGIRLAPGDFYSIDVNNTADIYVLASVDEEDIHFTYYT